jgi:hypothetical protein
LGFLITALTLALAAAILFMPAAIRTAVHGALANVGLVANGGQVSIGLDRTEITHLALSSRDAADLAATYSVGSLLRGQFKTLEVTDASFHGRISSDGSLVIDALQPGEPRSQQGSSFAIPAEQIVIRRVSLSLDTPMGPLSLTGKGALRPVDDGGLQFSGDIVAKGKGVELHAPLKLAIGPRGLVVDVEPVQSQQATGSVALHIAAARPDLLKKAGGTLRLRDFGFATSQVSVTGMNGSIGFTRISPLATADRQQLTIARVVLGEALTDASVAFAFHDGHVLSIDDAGGRIMGGHIGMQHQDIDLRGPEQSLTVQLTGIDLAQLLALANLTGLSGSGKLDGTVPIRHKNDTFQIDNAVMTATEPGLLRYDPADPPSFLKDAQSQEIVLLREALKDFHYRKLTLTINGQVGADEEIKMALTGSNPSLYNGKSIELNLDFTGSLDKIARWSLQSFASPLEAVRKLRPRPGANP